MQLTPNTNLIDLEYMGMPRLIGCCAIKSRERVLLVDPGPSSTLATLQSGLHQLCLCTEDIDSILLTHVHLDHAGATGSLVQQNPQIMVFVHENGAKHMVNPERLLRSAQRIYGEEEMDRLWGKFLPVPENNLMPLVGGEKLNFGDLRLEVAYTPGHASHHVSFLDSATGMAFVGDTAGIRISNEPYVIPVTPPPDVDVERWNQSMDQILAWHPEQILPTHFGAVKSVDEHFEMLRSGLQQWSEWVRESLAWADTDAVRASEFADKITQELKLYVPEHQFAQYRWGAGLDGAWYGLARYFRRLLEVNEIA